MRIMPDRSPTRCSQKPSCKVVDLKKDYVYPVHAAVRGRSHNQHPISTVTALPRTVAHYVTLTAPVERCFATRGWGRGGRAAAGWGRDGRAAAAVGSPANGKKVAATTFSRKTAASHNSSLQFSLHLRRPPCGLLLHLLLCDLLLLLLRHGADAGGRGGIAWPTLPATSSTCI